MVRVNAPPLGLEDVRAIAPHGVHAFILPKIEEPHIVAAFDQLARDVLRPTPSARRKAENAARAVGIQPLAPVYSDIDNEDGSCGHRRHRGAIGGSVRELLGRRWSGCLRAARVRLGRFAGNLVDQVVVVDTIGDSAKIVSGTNKITNSPDQLLIAGSHRHIYVAKNRR